MGGYTAIADIGDTLVTLLQDNMKELIASENSIILGLPNDHETPRISLFLYKAEENACLKNQNRIEIDHETYENPPLALDLHYLLTVYSSGTDRIGTSEELRILGRAMQVLYDHSIIAAPQLQGGLKDSEDEFRITLDPMSLDDLTKVWTTFPKLAYRTSAAYMVTPVTIDSLMVTKESKVLKSQFHYIQKEVNQKRTGIQGSQE